jgi:NADH:ubiquinone oxidoreductase subunit 6 (subunit J)
METLICGAVMVLIAFACLTQSRKSQAAGDRNKARLWMVASILAGAMAVVSIAGAIAG